MYCRIVVKSRAFLVSTDRQDSSQLLYYFYGLTVAYSAGLAQCHIINNLKKNQMYIQINLT